MKPTAMIAHSFASRTRRISVACGVAALLMLAFAGEGVQSERVALVALAALGLATMLGWSQLFIGRRLRRSIPDRIQHRRSSEWVLATTAVVLTAGLAVQTWFRPGTTIASGDVAPPEGTAWLARLFEPWSWPGSSLGEPSQLPLQLPWAAILSIVNGVGGDPELAQRIWYTTLFVGAGLGAFGLLVALGMRPVAAVVGSAVYLFNPYVVAVVNTNPVFIAALGLLAAMPAAIFAAGSGRLSVRQGASLVALAAPVFGYVDLNPPLVGMVIGAMLAAPLVAGWVDGREAAFRSLRTLALAIPLLLATSAYWIVPAILHQPSVVTDQLASLSSWNWTEARATIRNAFWLNTSWAWAFPQYDPYATAYDVLPLSLIRFVLPAIAFGALALGDVTHHTDNRAFRLVVAASTGGVVIIFLSTGTNPPGNLAFDSLYRLPFGWLLREPGRFLMLGSLTYAVMVGVLVDRLHSRRWRITGLRHEFARALRVSVAPLALGTVLSLGFPLYTGFVVPDSRPILPAAHVKMPTYWTEMARFVDALPTGGALLIMPPDDFYQMPYTWGYYGTDNFIANLFRRPVLVPNGQGYSPASAQLVSAVGLTAKSIRERDWPQAEALVTALDTPLILVRRDIETPFYDRAIVPPSDLADALSTAPNFELVRRIGFLELFVLRGSPLASESLSSAVTINSPTPDFRILALLPPGTALVSSPSQAGVRSVLQAPPLEMWQDGRDGLAWQASIPQGRSYQVAELGSKAVIPLDHPGSFTVGPLGFRAAYTGDVVSSAVTVTVPGRAAISNGDFANGGWGPVSDCHDLRAAQAKPYLGAYVVPKGAPGGLPALRLSARFDSACESQQLDWHGGSLVLSLMVHAGQGNPPRICLWEVGAERCASLATLPEGSGWSSYRTSVTPDPKTTGVDVFLYADGEGTDTVSEYANVRIIEVPALPSFVLLANPSGQPESSQQLVVLHNSFSTQWASTSGTHVVVDGMLNGWLIPTGSHAAFYAHYKPANAFRTAQWISLAALFVILLIPAWTRAARLAARKLGRSPAQR